MLRGMSMSVGRAVASEGGVLPSVAEWKRAIAPYTQARTRIALWQLANTLVPLAALWVAMAYCAEYSLLAALPLAVIAGLFLVRTFIIFHDCGHGSFFRSRWANDVAGVVTGLLVITPYHQWRWEHAQHHATSGDLDRREVGDVWTMTLEEYRAASPSLRLRYRFARNPLVLFLVAPFWLFVLKQRRPNANASPFIKRTVWYTNLALVVKATLFSLWIGFGPYLALQLTAVAVAGAGGVWLFFVQHQFDGVYWGRSKDWDYTEAALKGSSFYDLPAVLRWFSGNIGYHHLHHLSPRIPNYELVACHEHAGISDTVEPLTLLGSLRSTRLHLWDEARRKLVSFRSARRL